MFVKENLNSNKKFNKKKYSDNQHIFILFVFITFDYLALESENLL
jgi:hypothetical protein